jgi:hypothetical protein
MKKVNFLFAFLLCVGSLAAVQAKADTLVNCTWSYVGGANYPGGSVSIDVCFFPDRKSNAGYRRIEQPYSCAITLNEGYYNTGSCQQPVIWKKDQIASSSSKSSSSSASSVRRILNSGTCFNQGCAAPYQSCTNANGIFEMVGNNFTCYAR